MHRAKIAQRRHMTDEALLAQSSPAASGVDDNLWR
jgi:hypothetical protein